MAFSLCGMLPFAVTTCGFMFRLTELSVRAGPEFYDGKSVSIELVRPLFSMGQRLAHQSVSAPLFVTSSSNWTAKSHVNTADEIGSMDMSV